jgi:hypothetical protein
LLENLKKFSLVALKYEGSNRLNNWNERRKVWTRANVTLISKKLLSHPISSTRFLYRNLISSNSV